jgi:hypothetical protein
MTSTSGRGLLLRGGRTKRFDHCVELLIDLAELESRNSAATARRTLGSGDLLWRMVGGKIVLHARAPGLMDDLITFRFGRHVRHRVELIQAAAILD